MLLNQDKADSRSFLETFQGKRNDESSLAASAPMHDYETISLVFSGVKRLPAQPPVPTPSKDSDVARQIWTSRNLVLFIKKTTIIVWLHFIFIYLSHRTYQDSFRIASLSKEFRRYVNIDMHGTSSLSPPLPSWYSQKKKKLSVGVCGPLPKTLTLFMSKICVLWPEKQLLIKKNIPRWRLECKNSIYNQIGWKLYPLGPHIPV